MSQAAGAAINVVGGAVFARFSRQDEAEADQEGFNNTVRAGVSPVGMVTMFRKLLEERKSHPGAIESMFLTHPLEDDRIQADQALINQLPASTLTSLAAEVLVNDMGAQAALIKGGHLDSGNRVVDMLYDGDVRTFRGQRLDTTSTHGTGCTLSAAITAQLANGESLHAAVRRAIDYVHNAIATAPGLGSGHGPLNHLAEDH